VFYTDLNKVVIGRQAPADDDLIYVNQNFLFPSTRSCGILKKYPGIAKLVSRLVWERVAPPSSWNIPCPQSLDTPAIQALPPQAEVVKKTT